MRRTAVLVVGTLLLAAAGIFFMYDDHPPGWGLTASERADIEAGGWKEALDPLETIPTEGDAAAEEVAARLAERYCSERETLRLEEHNTDHDYVMFIPGCLDVDEPEDRLESPTAAIEVHVGPLPQLHIDAVGPRGCSVNAGRQYEDHGTCVRNLLRRALDKG